MVSCSSKCDRKPRDFKQEERVAVSGLSEGKPWYPNKVRIPAQEGEEAGQVCVLNRS